MNLDEFRKMWEDDGLQFVEIDAAHSDGADWYFYNVTEPQSTEYGRHYALIVGERYGEVIAHNFKNTSGGNWTKVTEEWWARHVAGGLLDEKGARL